MKLFPEQNYYEILDIHPSATPFEIRHAYKKAFQLYNDSLASYSFFSEDERSEILTRLETAFMTLINEETRSEYDRKLIDEGAVEEEMLCRRKKPIPIFDLKNSVSPDIIPEGSSAQTDANPVVANILNREIVTGSDLRRIRTELGVTIEYISDRTKVRPGLLRSLEEDRFDDLPSRFHMQKFLEFYVECLNLDPGPVVEKYMKRINDKP
ncbi:MAG: helix-turn-helix domain-containing protein [Syntrophales bacterium]